MTRDETANSPSVVPDGPPRPDRTLATNRPAPTPPALGEHVAGRSWGREAVSTAVEVTATGVLSAGFWLLRPWAGLLVLGAGLIVFGFASWPRFNRPEDPQ